MKGTLFNTLLVAAAQAFAAVGSLIATLLFARIMGPDGFGQAMAAISALLLVSLLLSFNIESVAPRFLLLGNAVDKAGYLRGSRILVLKASLCWAIVVLAYSALSQGISALDSAVIILAPMLAALSRLSAKLGATLQKIRAATLPRLLIRPIVMFGAALIFLLLNTTPTPMAIIALFLISAALTLFIQGVLLRTAFDGFSKATSGRNTSIWWKQGLLLAPSFLFLEMFRDLVLAAAALGLPSADLGVLAAALSLIAVPGFILIAVEITSTPKIAQAIAQDDPIKRDRLMRQSAMMRIAGVLLCCALLMFLRFPLTAFLGLEYHAAASLLPILLLVPLTRMLIGNPVTILAISGKAGSVFLSAGIGAGISFGLIAVSGMTHDLGQTALVIAGCYACMQAIFATQCFKRTGINPTGLYWPIGQRLSASPDLADKQTRTAQKAGSTA